MAEYMKVISKQTTITTFVDQSTQNGLYSLINWLDGFEARGGSVPGHFELVMYFRQIQDGIKAAEQQLQPDNTASPVAG